MDEGHALLYGVVLHARVAANRELLLYLSGGGAQAQTDLDELGLCTLKPAPHRVKKRIATGTSKLPKLAESYASTPTNCCASD
jgi:hypothetical protein